MPSEKAGSTVPTVLVAGVDPIKPAYATNNIPVFLGCDDLYFPHAMTVIASLIDNGTAENNYDVLIVQEGVPAQRLARASQWAAKFSNLSLRFIDMDKVMDGVGRRMFHASRQITLAAYYRMFAPSIFTSYERIIYLDSDVVVLGDLAELFRCNLAGRLLAGCRDISLRMEARLHPAFAVYLQEKLGLDSGDDYINSGVLLLDLDRIRQEGLDKKLFANARTIENPHYHDQDIINATMKGRVKILGYEWNCCDAVLIDSDGLTDHTYLDADSQTYVRSALDNIKIYHYTGHKPNSRLYNGNRDGYYWRYASRTPFYAELKAAFMRHCSPWVIFPRYLNSTVRTFLYRLRFLITPADKREKLLKKLHKMNSRKDRMWNLMRRFGPLGYAGLKDYEGEN